MILEEVQSHQFRDDIYINNVITSHESVQERDKQLVKNILLKETSRTSFLEILK